MMDKLLTVDEVAEYLRLNRETVLRKARKGEIPAIRMGYRSYRFYKGQIDDWLRGEAVSKSIATPKETKVLDLPSYDLGVIKGSLSRREIYGDL
jgi:excisionase family DNA binding protein